MIVCSACGAENDGDARFCKSCGVSLAAAEVREQRKMVTVVFCDVVGSTALGESQDPEAVRMLLMRYFERMRGIVEAHGGTVQKFIGDAVVSVFGVPVVHEDDALRAVRAAVEMRAALPQLQVGARIGVNTGEVVTSSDDTLVTGDAVNVAARLQQAASPGEILIGEPTRALVRDAISVEELAPLELKGKAEPVPAYRLVTVGDAPERSHRSRFVGRHKELAVLGAAWERALADDRCELVTIVGEPGIGKSRLVAELTGGLDARIVGGRCLSYGEGIGYFPVVEVIRQLGVSAVDPAVAATIASLVGESEAPTSPDEIAWAFRKLLEQEAPLVVVFDDIQWGGEAFLDLVEHLPSLSAGASLLLVCMARPELAERRPRWPVALRLKPLAPAEVEALLSGEVAGGQRERILRAAGGNPLFVNEMVAMASAADGEVAVPATLKALLAARLDQIEGAERGVLERGAVEGEVFHRGPVQALTGTQVTPQLGSLVRRELIRPDSGLLPGDDAFRFCHLLVRDAAYDALPKVVRAELHGRFAGWLEQHAAGLVERDEIVGYHLQQAYRYRAELGRLDAETRELGELAAAHLRAAGLRATDRGDVHAAASLLGRALEVGIAEPRERAHLQVELGEALAGTGQRMEADAVMAEAIEAATAVGERGLAASALAMRALRRHRYVEDGLASVGAAAEEAIQICSELGDTRGLAVAWRLLAWTLNHQGRLLDTSYHERALEFAEASGDRRARRSAIVGICGILCLLPIPAGEGIGRVEELLAGARDDRVLEARVKLHLAHLYAMAGRSEEALETLRESAEVLDELNDYSDWIGWINWANARELAGDRVGAEKGMAEALSYFQELDVAPTAKQVSVALALFYCDDGRWEEAASLVVHRRELALLENPLRAAVRLAAEARVAAHSGELDEAVAIAERAVAVVDTAVYPNDRARIRLALAEVYRAAGRQADADAATAAALELYELKGNVAAAARVRARASSS
jgi:class 3 adenylate cyclase/tetratricopeptide (TPR) repeat protein